jgi:hypothetical protein
MGLRRTLIYYAKKSIIIESLVTVFWRGGIMAIDYSNEKKEFMAELEAGEYDLEISPNKWMNYRDIEDSDFLAFIDD